MEMGTRIDPQTVPDGSIVWVLVHNRRLNPPSQGKPRPALLVRRWSGWIQTACMCSREMCEETGLPRLPVPYAPTLGVTGQGYFWDDHLRRLTDDSIIRVSGFAHAELIQCIYDEFDDLDDLDLDALTRIYQSITFRSPLLATA